MCQHPKEKENTVLKVHWFQKHIAWTSVENITKNKNTRICCVLKGYG